MDKQNSGASATYEWLGPRNVAVPMLPKLSSKLLDFLSVWEPFASDALIVLQEKADDRVGQLYLADKTVKKQQMNIGTGWVIAKCRDKNHINERLSDIQIGDRVKYPSGVTISAEVPRDVPEWERVQILHTQNLIQICRCGTDNLQGIPESESTPETSESSSDAGPQENAQGSPQPQGHIVFEEEYKPSGTILLPNS